MFQLPTRGRVVMLVEGRHWYPWFAEDQFLTPWGIHPNIESCWLWRHCRQIQTNPRMGWIGDDTTNRHGSVRNGRFIPRCGNFDRDNSHKSKTTVSRNWSLKPIHWRLKMGKLGSFLPRFPWSAGILGRLVGPGSVAWNIDGRSFVMDRTSGYVSNRRKNIVNHPKGFGLWKMIFTPLKEKNKHTYFSLVTKLNLNHWTMNLQYPLVN